MKNRLHDNHIVPGKLYMVKANGEDAQSLRILSETPTHFIFSLSNGESVEVFEKAKEQLDGIYEIKDWWKDKEH